MSAIAKAAETIAKARIAAKVPSLPRTGTMRFRPTVKLDTSQVEDRRERRRERVLLAPGRSKSKAV